MKRILPTLSASLLLLATSCTIHINTSDKKEKRLTNISDTSWQLADATGTTLPTINIVKDNKITGNGSCNNYSANLQTLPDGSFSVKDIISTKMYCNKNETEANFFDLLKKANKYKATKKNLELYKDGLLLLKLNRIP